MVIKLSLCRKVGDMKAWSCMLLVVSGGCWPRTRRRAELNPLQRTDCPRCGEPDEDLYHRVWPCPGNRNHEDYERSQFLLMRAERGAEQCPAFWLRGVPPRAWTHPKYDDLAPPIVIKHGCWMEQIAAGIARRAS